MDLNKLFSPKNKKNNLLINSWKVVEIYEYLSENSHNKINDYLVIDNLCIEAKNKTGIVKILSDVNFELHPNSFHVFIGENGAGKSTTIKTIIGMIEKYAGSIYFNSSKQLNREKIFYVQDYQPKFPHISLFKYLWNLTRLLTDKSNEMIIKEIDEYLVKYSLEHVKYNNINKLSTGQKQKVLIISSFLADKPYIILDEPFANLDQTSRYLFMNELKKLSKLNKCIFLSSHIIDEIQNYATHATFIKKGKIIKTGEIKNAKEIKKIYFDQYINN